MNDKNLSLLRPEHVLYARAWHDRIGDRERVLYNAIGPDISSVLFATNPREVVGVDVIPFDSELLYYYMGDNFKNLNLGFKNQDCSLLGIIKDILNNQCPLHVLEKKVSKRKKLGYWSIKDLKTFPLELLLSVELKSLGVSYEDIEILDIDSFSFDWSHNGEEPQKRLFRYVKGPLDNIADEGINEIGSFDCFYQKSLPDITLIFRYLALVDKLVKKDSTLLIGRVNHFLDEYYKQRIIKTLGENYKELEIDKDSLDPEFNYEQNSYEFGFFGFEKIS
jgi:hypothetical protein